MSFLCTGGGGVVGFFAVLWKLSTGPHCHCSLSSHSLLGGGIPTITVADVWSIFRTAPGYIALRFKIFQGSTLGSELLTIVCRIFSSSFLPFSQIMCSSVLCRGLPCLWAFAGAFAIVFAHPHQFYQANTFASFKSQFKCSFLGKASLDSCRLVWFSLLYAP